jgi:hypothetical protein
MSFKKLDRFPRTRAVPIITIPLAFRRAAASAVHSADLPTSHSRRMARPPQSVLIWLCIAGRREHYRFRISDTNALRTSDCEIPNCRAILDGVTPALKAARTAFNFPCVKGTAATTSTACLRETAASFFPRCFCSAMTADSNWSSSWSSSCLTAFGKSAGRTWRGGIALGEPTDSEDCE